MPGSPLPLILNPAAGRGRAGKSARAIVELLAAQGVPVSVSETTGVGDLESQVREYAATGRGSILVAGGDGSVHEAVNGILAADADLSLGLVPIGTGNDFAKACGISLDWETAATLLAARISDDAPRRRIDAGRMNDRYFANGLGIGFDAKVNQIARKRRWPIGDFVYLVAAVEGLWDGVITPSVVMRYGSEEYRGRITLANVSNGAWVGGMFHIAPMAANDDGKFDLVIAKPVSRRRAVRLLPKLVRGSHVNERDIVCERIESFELVADEPVPSHLDGEAQPMQTEFRVAMLKNALSII
jgi:diacylglycerol kinase (ATP)